MKKKKQKTLPVVLLLIVLPILLALILFAVIFFSWNSQVQEIKKEIIADCYRFHSCENLDTCPTEEGAMKCDFIGKDNPSYYDCLDRRTKCLNDIK